ncbi:MAG: hypothetical protein HC905_29645 [Bacteroidales bacterium]|nr:hypothetical protein [Bacteroidales bacterium]
MDTATVLEKGFISGTVKISWDDNISVYPNPMSSLLNISYQISEAKTIKFEVYTLAGSKVYSATAGHQTSGKHHFIWNGRDQWGNLLPMVFMHCGWI